jgi:hypothetical protein
MKKLNPHATGLFISSSAGVKKAAKIEPTAATAPATIAPATAPMPASGPKN